MKSEIFSWRGEFAIRMWSSNETNSLQKQEYESSAEINATIQLVNLKAVDRELIINRDSSIFKTMMIF